MWASGRRSTSSMSRSCCLVAQEKQIVAQRDSVVAAYTLLAAMGGLDAVDLEAAEYISTTQPSTTSWSRASGTACARPMDADAVRSGDRTDPSGSLIEFKRMLVVSCSGIDETGRPFARPFRFAHLRHQSSGGLDSCVGGFGGAAVPT